MSEKNRQLDEEIDSLGRLVLRSATTSEAEAEAAADAPFLFSRVRTAITEEQRRRDEAGGWLSMLFVARRAVPAMAVITILVAILTAWSAQLSPARPVNFDEEALFGTPGPSVEQTVLADRNGISQDDVFNIVLDREYGRNTR